MEGREEYLVALKGRHKSFDLPVHLTRTAQSMGVDGCLTIIYNKCCLICLYCVPLFGRRSITSHLLFVNGESTHSCRILNQILARPLAGGIGPSGRPRDIKLVALARCSRRCLLTTGDPMSTLLGSIPTDISQVSIDETMTTSGHNVAHPPVISINPARMGSR